MQKEDSIFDDWYEAEDRVPRTETLVEALVELMWWSFIIGAVVVAFYKI